MLLKVVDMGISGKALRELERALHLASGVLLLVLVYTPFGAGEVGFALRVMLTPMLVISGVAMWQHAKVTRLLKGRSVARSAAR